MKSAMKMKAIPIILFALLTILAFPAAASASDTSTQPPASDAGAQATIADQPPATTDFPLQTDGLNSQSGGLFVSEPLVGYGFFPQDGESRYAAAEQNASMQDNALRDTLFKGEAVGAQTEYAPPTAPTGMFAKTPAYAEGRFDEQNAGQNQNGIIAVVIIGLCALSFFCAREWSKMKTKKRLAEASASKEEN